MTKHTGYNLEKNKYVFFVLLFPNERNSITNRNYNCDKVDRREEGEREREGEGELRNSSVLNPTLSTFCYPFFLINYILCTVVRYTSPSLIERERELELLMSLLIYTNIYANDSK